MAGGVEMMEGMGGRLDVEAVLLLFRKERKELKKRKGREGKGKEGKKEKKELLLRWGWVVGD